MHYNRILGFGGVELADAIGSSKSLQVLDISYNSLCGTGITKKKEEMTEEEEKKKEEEKKAAGGKKKKKPKKQIQGSGRLTARPGYVESVDDELQHLAVPSVHQRNNSSPQKL